MTLIIIKALFLFLIPFLLLLFFSLGERKGNPYYSSSYYKSTHLPYEKMKKDKGRYGEFLIYEELKETEKEGAKFLFNCYLGKEKKTEIDIILLHKSGVYVIESKNYSGSVYGKEEEKTWTQYFYKNGKSYTFFNPIFQNNSHINALKYILPSSVPIYSVIVFSDRCEIKGIKVESNDVVITKVGGVREKIESGFVPRLEQNEIDRLYKLLLPYTKVSFWTKIGHIFQVKKKKGQL